MKTIEIPSSEAGKTYYLIARSKVPKDCPSILYPRIDEVTDIPCCGVSRVSIIAVCTFLHKEGDPICMDCSYNDKEPVTTTATVQQITRLSIVE